MTDPLVTPWTGSLLAAAAPALGFDPARLPPVAVPGAAGRFAGGDALACPWSGRAVLPRALPPVCALPTLGPDLPVQRAAVEPAPVLV